MWNFFFRIMLNGLLFLYDSLGRNFALSIAILTILVRLLTLPITIKQQRNSRRMQELQPEVQRLQKKHKDDPQKLQEELGKIGYTSGMMLWGCLPMLIQLPIWIWLYQSIVQALSNNPTQLFNLSKNIYPAFSHLVPLNPYFLGIDLALSPQQSGNLLGYTLVILVVATMWLQQKMMTTPSGDPQTAQMNQTMQVTMPLMFGFISLQFASGLALYFVVSNIVGIVIQYFISGQGALFQREPKKSGAREKATMPVKTEPAETVTQKGKKRGRKKKRRR